MNTSDPVILIPCRMESLRFPGKPLAPLAGIPMVMRCAKNAVQAGFQTYICTDSQVIVQAALYFNFNVIETPQFNTGTDRINWASNQIDAEIIINLQGDEPLITPQALRVFGNATTQLLSSDYSILNGLAPLDNSKAFDVNNVKAVTTSHGKILYLSRKAIRNSAPNNDQYIYIKQLGLYAFSRQSLNCFASIGQTSLEKAENIEMLRWLDFDYNLLGINLDTPSISVDTPEDLAEAEDVLANS